MTKVLGCFKTVAQLTIAGIKTIFKKRKNGTRIYILSFATIFIVFLGVENAVRTIDYLFYRLQYLLTDSSYSNLTTLQTTLKLFCQVVLVPFLSGYLEWRDTTILLVAISCTILSQFGTALLSQLWALYLGYVLNMLWNSITTTARSNMSKLMESNEIGKAFTFLAIFTGIIPIATKPFFAFLYKNTLETFPGAYKILSASLYLGILLIILLTHFGLKRLEKPNSPAVNQEETESKV